jgi:hypothetical protein
MDASHMSARAFGTILPLIDIDVALAGWMHRVCADLAGCYETSDCWMLRLGWSVA